MSWLPNMNMIMPTDMSTAVTYSYTSYLLRDTNLPINITGITLQDFDSTCNFIHIPYFY